MSVAMPKPKPRRRRIRARTIIVPLLFVVTVLGGTLAGYLVATTDDLPGVTELESYRPSVITQVLADDSTVVGEFAVEWRILIPYEEISKNFIDAIVAVEDAQFAKHSGVNVLAIIRAAIKNFRAGHVVEGGSTITQQLAKLLFLTPEKSLERKINEAILATQIERHYTKEQILEFYSNKIYLGNGVYGVEAGAQYYFDKPARDLSVVEAATLAGIPKNPSEYAPDVNPKRCLERRNHVLRRMREESYIGDDEYAAAEKSPIVLKRGLRRTTTGLYFVEEVRQYVEKRYGADKLYRSGLKVATTMNRELQETAELAVRRGLHDLDMLQGWRGEVPNIQGESAEAPGDEELASYVSPDWKRQLKDGRYCHALVTSVSQERAELRLGRYRAVVDKANSQWIWKKLGSYDMTKALRRGDLPVVLIDQLGGDGGPKVELVQEPKVEGALIAIEVGTGHIKAIVGGYDFDRSKFDRATQALRQVGSAFKPVVYCAAMDNGFRQTDMLLDAPLNLLDKSTGRVYSPRNYDHKFLGPIPIWKALAQSRNVPAVRMLLELGANTVVDYGRLLGISSNLPAYPSLALGAAEVTPLEMATAYSVFPNQGVLVEPTLVRHIVDQDGNVIEEHRAKAKPVIRADTAMVMTDLLSGVVKFGTATKAKKLANALAGKTGTTNDYTDAWFVGFSPDIVVATWVGFDAKKTLGNRRTGGSTALPIWMDFMTEYLKDHPADAWNEPGSVIRVKVDRTTGLRAGPDCSNQNVVDRIFQRGTEPEQVCSMAAHARLAAALAEEAEGDAEAPAADVPPADVRELELPPRRLEISP